MKAWVYKIKYSAIRTIQTQWKAMISMVFAVIGGAFTIAEILNNVFDTEIGFQVMREYATHGLCVTLMVCLVMFWKPLKYECFIGDGDRKITLCVCDIFHQKGALIIPTNTTFDTLMDDEFISITSVQGQYQEKYHKHALKQLDDALARNLDGNPYVVLNDGRTTNKKRYPIGTISKITRGTQHDYFLAIADINKFGKPENVSYQSITSALVSLWQELNKIGHLENIRIPIVGTGRAGLHDASRDQIIQEIIFTFVVAAREMNVSENLIICVHPSDFANKNLHWDDLCDYLRYTCKYVNQQKGRPEGKPEDEYNGIPENVVIF